jgi:predicted sugar kinase
VLRGVAGRISDCEIGDIAKGGLLSEDAAGLEITHRIERIAAKRGGSGQNGNGVNVFRAGGVLVSGNRIVDCAFFRDPLQFRLQLPDDREFLRAPRGSGALCRIRL